MTTPRAIYLITRRNGIMEAYTSKESAELVQEVDTILSGTTPPIQRLPLYR